MSTPWIKYGCFGCAGLAGFILLVAAGLTGVAFLQVRGEKVEEQTLRPALPTFAAPAGTPADDLKPAITGGGITDQFAVDAPGKVVLDFSQAEFFVQPAAPGEALHVEATYDRNSYVLEEQVEMPEDGEPWNYRVSFRRSGHSSLISGLKRLLGGSRPQVRVFLPRDRLLDLEASMSQGGTEMELGGLWLRRARLVFRQGGFTLRLGEPLRAPMEELEIEGSMGGFAVRELGNASPHRIGIDFSMGGMDLDLRGQWLNDADIDIRTSMGGAAVRLPQDLAIEGITLARPRPPATAEFPGLTLRFTVSSSMGEIDFRE